MKRLVASLVVAVACFATGAQVGSARALHEQSLQMGLKRCSSSYVPAHLSWGDKCLRAGEFCKVRNREYLSYGFVCPSSGHLRRR
jgi:hypothetical protein